ncbi:alpha-amylase family glycosyl hydrolase [Actinomycetaceae bacterium L2_0104]
MSSLTDPSVHPQSGNRLVADADWWRQAAVYQIYPRSFADANGDGIGDLRGIISRIDYLATLGIDAVWLSPFYPSQLADGGYDVDDYRDVDPRIGTLDEFDEMLAELHAVGIRVIVDIVPNHTSDRHIMFREALAAGRGSAERDRYIFREGRGGNGELPPADWTSNFGGPAWSRVHDGQWYLHNFAPEQPDVNWDSPEIHEEFIRTLRFWADRGVDGFRIDVAHGLAKDLPEVLPSQAELDALPHDGNHPLWDRDDVHEIYAQWRTVFNEYSPARTAVAEAWVHSDRLPPYASPNGLGQAFNFDLLQADFNAAQFKRIVSHNMDLAARSGSSSTWVLSNHDVVRHPTRYGLPDSPRDNAGKVLQQSGAAFEWLLSGGTSPALDRAGGLRRARAATMFMLSLPGSAYLYQGEELGLHEVVEIEPGQRQDPTFFRTEGRDIGRDGCRVPLPWTSKRPAFGFSEHDAHLPQPDWFAEASVQAEDSEPSSTLNLYREALHLRQRLQPAERMEWVQGLCGEEVLAFVRPGGWLTVTNFGATAVDMPAGKVLLSSSPLENGRLPRETTAWLLPDEQA